MLLLNFKYLAISYRKKRFIVPAPSRKPRHSDEEKKGNRKSDREERQKDKQTEDQAEQMPNNNSGEKLPKESGRPQKTSGVTFIKISA